jgi:hypothetical protein
LIADCVKLAQAASPPSDRFRISAGLGLAGTPATEPPAAQTMPSAMSDAAPPHLPSTRTGRILALGATPVTPSALLPAAAMVPATWVPCQLLLAASSSAPHCLAVTLSPGSLALLSRPPPSPARVASVMKS